MRLSVDTGGTFTDLVVEEPEGGCRVYKSPTTPDDPVAGVLDVLRKAATSRNEQLSSFLSRCDVFVHATTHAINAVVTGALPTTALLVTQGHRDVLVVREGGRHSPFDHRIAYPQPLIPRALTFEVPERIVADGRVLTSLDEDAVRRTLAGLGDRGVESVAVCLLWSIANGAHEDRIGELIAECLPGVPYTLSHRLNPIIREYRRAAATSLDAALKPLMQRYIGTLQGQLEADGFRGRLLIVTSTGGVLEADEVARSPIHCLNSGPAVAPVAGARYSVGDLAEDNVIVADTGGTTFDISVVRDGTIPRTSEVWLGTPRASHLTGFPSVDVRSIGAGGGSIAWVDPGGMLRVGPQSAGSQPGPACYGNGGVHPTVTDACVVLGILDPEYFLAGSVTLDVEAARTALEVDLAEPLGLSVEAAASAIMQLVTEQMVSAIELITTNQGIDPSRSVLVGGGGAAGLNIAEIGRSLGCRAVLIPGTGAVLSAVGALLSDVTRDFADMRYTSTGDFDEPGVNAVLAELRDEAESFIAEQTAGSSITSEVRFEADARYPRQVWELALPLQRERFTTPGHAKELADDFHDLHRRIFAIEDRGSPVEIVTWRAQARCHTGARDLPSVTGGDQPVQHLQRPVFMPGHGRVAAEIVRCSGPAPRDLDLAGPAVVEFPASTIVVPPGAVATVTDSGGLVVSW